MFESHCAVCLESITDPVCIYCYIKQVRMWFNDLEIDPVFKKFAINKIKSRLSFQGISEIGCIICGSENVDVCFYCFGYMTIQVLRELNLPENMIESFSESFNYNLMGRELYSHEDFRINEDNTDKINI